MIALAALPIRAEEPVNRTIKMPARESYRKPYDTWQCREQDRIRSSSGISKSRFRRRRSLIRCSSTGSTCIPRNWNPATPRRFICKPGRNIEKIYAEAEKKLVRLERILRVEEERRFRGYKILGELFARSRSSLIGRSSFPKSVSPEEEAKFYKSMEPVYQLLEKASGCAMPTGAIAWRYRGSDLFRPIQNTRALARYLGGKADWEIRNGKYEDAVKTLRIGISLGNHVAKANSPTLVGMLVGIAIQGIMQEPIMTLASQPDAPNLYPASDANHSPRRCVPICHAGRAILLFSHTERHADLRNIDKASPEECRGRLENVVAAFLLDDKRSGGTPRKSLRFPRQ